MDHSPIHKNISSRIQVDETDLTLFDTHVQYKNVAKKEVLLREGDSCKYLNYVHSGSLRSYVIDKQGKETTVMFAVADWWLTDMFCFLNQKPAMMYIEALQDSVIIQLSKTDLDEIFIQMPKFEKFFRLLMQNAYTREQLRMIERLTRPAEDRYDAFLSGYPNIANTVTQKQIASYLGITPEFLSTIRKNKSKRNS